MNEPRERNGIQHWQRRLFGVACDAEEAERWLEAFAIYEHLLKTTTPDIELRLRLGRAAFHAGEYGTAEAQSHEADRLLTRHPDLRPTFGPEAASLRLKLQKLDWARWADTPPYP